MSYNPSMRLSWALAVLVITSFDASALAEESVEAQARSLFEQGLRAIEQSRFVEARDYLNRSLELYANQATVFNLAVALRGTGETRASIELIDQLLAGRYGELNEERLAQARESREASVRDLATLRIQAEGAPEIEIRVDGELLARLHSGEQTEHHVDSGSLLITASAPGHSTAERRTFLERGGEATVALRVIPLESSAETPTTREREATPRRRAWIWAVLGVGVAVVCAAIVTSILLTRPEDDGLEDDPVFGRVTTTLVDGL